MFQSLGVWSSGTVGFGILRVLEVGFQILGVRGFGVHEDASKAGIPFPIRLLRL